MGYFFMDDSCHTRHDFCLSCFLYCNSDPQEQLNSILSRHHLVPGKEEFKSSAPKAGNTSAALLRDDLQKFLRENGKIGVAVSRSPDRIPEDVEDLLVKMLRHPDVGPGPHQVYFDQGIFAHATDRVQVQFALKDTGCTLHLHADSKLYAGIQVADLAAHTCSMMLKDSMGLVNKTLKTGENSGYDPDLDIGLGFLMYASIRYSFLGEYPKYDDSKSQLELARINTERYSLLIGSDVDEPIREAALSRFGSVYIGCTH